MAQNEYKPVSWNGEAITTNKLNQMANNTQFLFERTPRIRYSSDGLTKDSGIKMLAGKASRKTTTANFVYYEIYFGNFFTVGCKPVVTGGVEAGHHRSHVVFQGFSGEIDHTGCTAVIAVEVDNLAYPGWVHWVAVGY